jgi:hypothetical protein
LDLLPYCGLCFRLVRVGRACLSPLLNGSYVFREILDDSLGFCVKDAVGLDETELDEDCQFDLVWYFSR